jgi:ankyrin repeat protein
LRTALHIACMRGRLDFSKLLLERGADPNIQDIEGNTPLHLAAENQFKDIILLLLQKNPNVFIKNKQGKTPMEVVGNSSRVLKVSY